MLKNIQVYINGFFVLQRKEIVFSGHVDILIGIHIAVDPEFESGPVAVEFLLAVTFPFHVAIIIHNQVVIAQAHFG